MVVRQTRYRLAMARKKTQEGDAIARLADAGEDALRQLVDFPQRFATRSVDDLRQQMNHIVGRLRAIDPLVARVTKLEERVNAIEGKTGKPAKRRASTRTKTQPRPRPPATAAPPPAEADAGMPAVAAADEARPGDSPGHPLPGQR